MLSCILFSNTCDYSAPWGHIQTPKTERVLVCAPHPDDDVIGCGGSIAKYKQQGSEVFIVYMTSGEAAKSKYTNTKLARIREQEAQSAAKILGVNATYFLRNPDGNLALDQSTLLALINLIRTIRPTIVYTTHQKDAHKDHMMTYEIVTQAVTKAADKTFKECEGASWTVDTVLCYEVWTPLQEVSYVEDISAFMSLKIEALRQHASQIQDLRYDDAIEGLNRYRGVMTQRGKHCECFQIWEKTNKSH